VRLTKTVLPTRYEINLKPDLETFVFDGETTIHLTFKKPTKTITLHAIELTIDEVAIMSKKGNQSAQKISYDAKAETATFTFKDTIPQGKSSLRIAFRGTLNDRMHGFYRSSYEVNGVKRFMATTQFEATDARRAFPCFDEPAMKAVFDVSLTVPATSTAISNTIAVDTQKDSNGLTTVRFAPTPLMSTYLLAFIVGDFEYIEKRTRDGVLVRVFATPGKKKQLEFSLDCAAKIISFFNQYFDIPYPMPVLNMIAIPDFAAGAMENWGAITYRESALLVDAKQSSSANKQWVALVIAHEIAHQWFGNLVTMEWWTDLWLNEGFASYIEYLAVNHVFPEWDIWTQFLQADFGVALHYDGLKHTHPIEVEVHHPSEITAAFDAVSYSKGASTLRMLAEYLGENDFRSGLRYYLKKHRYGNTSTADLWNALQKISGKPVAAMMKHWTGKAGYPLLTVSERGEYIEVKQSRFFASALSEKETKDTTLWHIPVSTVTASKKTQKPFLMDTRTARFPKTTDGWIKLNVNESGFYRTKYSETLRALLAEAVAKNNLKTRDRLGLIRDVMALAETGKQSSIDGLEFARYYQAEDAYVVWAALASGLGKLHSILAREVFLKAYDAFALDIFADIGKKITWNKKPKDHSEALLKVLVLANLGKYGDAKTIAHTKKMFTTIKGDRNPISADLRGVVYNLVAKHGGAKEYAKLLQMHKEASLHEEKNRIAMALGAFKQKDLLEKTLRFAISEQVRRQDSVRVISAVSLNPEGADLAWGFIKSNWKLFLERYGTSRDVSNLLSPLATSTFIERAQEIESFLKKNPAPGTERTLQQVVEQIRSNAAWLARDRKQLSAFLSK
jgi:puromycin-sensitive aminopeptidase